MIKEFESFMEEKRNDKTGNTIRAYEKTISRFLEYFKVENVEEIEEITANDFRGYRDDLLKSGLSNSSANSHFRNVGAFVRWLANYDYISTSINIDKVKILKTPKKIYLTLTPDECQRMVESTSNIGKKLMLVLMFQTGLRRAEITDIKITDIFNSHIKVRGKGDKERVLALTDEVCKLVKKYLKVKNVDSEYLFSHEGNKITGESVRSRVHGAAVRAGIEPERVALISPHTCRRTFATNMLNENGVSLDVLQKCLGHASVVTTQKYAKTSNKNVDEALLSQKSLTGG